MNLKSTLALFLMLTGCAEYAGTSGKSEISISFLGVTGAAPLESAAEQSADVRRYCSQSSPPVAEIRADEDRKAAIPAALTDATVTFFTTAVTQAIVAAVQSRQKRFAKTYNASINVSEFRLGSTTNRIRCVSVVRRVNGEPVSTLVFELVNQGETALYMRPIFADVRKLQSSTSVKDSEIGRADIVLSVGLKSILSDGKIATQTETFKVAKITTEVAHSAYGPFAPSGISQAAKSWAFIPARGTAGRYDTAYLPYFPGVPTTLSIAVTEVGAGGQDARANATAVADNKASIETVIKTAIAEAVNND